MMKLKVLGPGCPRCKNLAATVTQAANDLGMEVTIEKVTDIAEITSHGVMMTPALVVDGAVKLVGQTPGLEELKALLSAAAEEQQ